MKDSQQHQKNRSASRKLSSEHGATLVEALILTTICIIVAAGLVIINQYHSFQQPMYASHRAMGGDTEGYYRVCIDDLTGQRIMLPLHVECPLGMRNEIQKNDDDDPETFGDGEPTTFSGGNWD